MSLSLSLSLTRSCGSLTHAPKEPTRPPTHARTRSNTTPTTTKQQIDPATKEPDSDDEGEDDEYPLEDAEVTMSNFIAGVSVPNFRKEWEMLGADNEVTGKYSLPKKAVGEAVSDLVDLLGLVSP